MDMVQAQETLISHLENMPIQGGSALGRDRIFFEGEDVSEDEVLLNDFASLMGVVISFQGTEGIQSLDLQFDGSFIFNVIVVVRHNRFLTHALQYISDRINEHEFMVVTNILPVVRSEDVYTMAIEVTMNSSLV